MAYNPYDPRQMRHRAIIDNPLSVSPEERRAHQAMEYAAEDRRRFNAAEARFREAERNRHAEQGFRDETDRMTAHGEYLNRREEDLTAYVKNKWDAANAAAAEAKRAPVDLGNGSVYDPERGVVVGEGGGWRLPGALDSEQKATPFSGLPAPAPAPDVPKAPEIVDLGNGRRGYWNGREWVELSESSGAGAGDGAAAPVRETTSAFGSNGF